MQGQEEEEEEKESEMQQVPLTDSPRRGQSAQQAEHEELLSSMDSELGSHR